MSGLTQSRGLIAFPIIDSVLSKATIGDGGINVVGTKWLRHRRP